jgi:hypothetical protein
MSFGKNSEGVNLYRINGSKEEIEKSIQAMKDLGCEVWQAYELERSHKHWSVLVKLQFPVLIQEEKQNG